MPAIVSGAFTIIAAPEAGVALQDVDAAAVTINTALGGLAAVSKG